ncbi:hypothetical protein ACVFVO_05620 [Advenella kashmirensis]
MSLTVLPISPHKGDPVVVFLSGTPVQTRAIPAIVTARPSMLRKAFPKRQLAGPTRAK